MRAAPFTVLVLALGCSGEPTQIGTGELFRVRASSKDPVPQFIKGALPGSPPEPAQPGATSDGGPKADAGAEPNPLPKIVTISPPSIAFQGQGDVAIPGFTTPNAASVGLALAGVSTGYWVLPVGEIDVGSDGNRPFAAIGDFDRSIPPGYAHLQAVAFDEHGTPGPQYGDAAGNPPKICIASQVPDSFNSCKPTTRLPEDVISLTWDTNVDLDLQVQTPDGRLVDPKNPTTLPPNDAGAIPKEAAEFDRDSNAACLIDGVRAENLVWPAGEAPHGQYLIYVNLFDACKQPAVTFTVTVYSARSDGSDAGNRFLKKYFERSGELLDFQANGGAARGLFVSEFNFD